MYTEIVKIIEGGMIGDKTFDEERKAEVHHTRRCYE